MSVTKKLATSKLGVNIAREFVQSFSRIDNSYFMYFGKHVPYGTRYAYNEENTVVTFDAKEGIVSDTFYTNAEIPFVDGDRIRYFTDTGVTPITGLANNSIYYVINSQGSAFQLSTSGSSQTPTDVAAKASSETHYFAYASGTAVVPTTGDVVETPLDSDRYSTTQTYDDMIFAKRITNRDVRLMVKKHIWTEDTVYAQYEDTDSNLSLKPFFVATDNLTEYNVFKCIYNNNNAPSTEMPTRSGNLLDYNTVEMSDGYKWKFMYTITKNEYERFATADYIPVIANNEIIENATPGTVNVIKVVTPGAGYNNYFTGTLRASDIRYLGEGTFYGLPDDASAEDDFYQNCVLKITQSQTPGIVGQYRTITASIGQGRKFVTLDSPFSATPTSGDTYEIYPLVSIWGDGNERIPATARAIVNSAASNSISRIEMLSVGEGYRNAVVNFILPNIITSSSSYKEATLEAVISPPLGHGSDPATELFAKNVGISVTVQESENGTIPTTNDFRSVGIIKNPRFNNVTLTFDDTSSDFTLGEEIVQYKSIKLFGTMQSAAGNTNLYKTGNGQIETTITIVNPGTGYDHNINEYLVFDDAGTGGSGAAGTFTANLAAVKSETFNAGTDVANSYINIPSHDFVDGDYVKYYTGLSANGVNGLSNNDYYYVVSSNTTHLRLSANNSASNFKLISNGTGGTSNSYLDVVNGAINSVTVTNRGSAYNIAPAVSINSDAGGQGAILQATLTNPDISTYSDVFEPGDLALVTSGNNIYVGVISRVTNDHNIVMTTPLPFTSANCVITKVDVTARGEVYSSTTGQVGVRNVTGIFEPGRKVLGVTSYATAIIKNEDSIKVNDKNAVNFATALQLTTLVGNINSGYTPFIGDEKIYQDSLIPYIQPSGRVHSVIDNAGDNNDVVYISREYGIFNMDPTGAREIYSDTSESVFTALARYPGDFMKDSGEVIYIENVDPISRNNSKSETVKIILEF